MFWVLHGDSDLCWECGDVSSEPWDVQDQESICPIFGVIALHCSTTGLRRSGPFSSSVALRTGWVLA